MPIILHYGEETVLVCACNPALWRGDSVIVGTCNPSPVKPETGGFKGQCQLELQNKTLSPIKEKIVKENVVCLI